MKTTLNVSVANRNLEAINGEDLLNMLITNHDPETYRYKPFSHIAVNIPKTDEFILITKELIIETLEEMIKNIKTRNLKQ